MKFFSVVYKTKDMRLSITYGVCIRISGGVNRVGSTFNRDIISEPEVTTITYTPSLGGFELVLVNMYVKIHGTLYI